MVHQIGDGKPLPGMLLAVDCIAPLISLLSLLLTIRTIWAPVPSGALIIVDPSLFKNNSCGVLAATATSTIAIFKARRGSANAAARASVFTCPFPNSYCMSHLLVQPSFS